MKKIYVRIFVFIVFCSFVISAAAQRLDVPAPNDYDEPLPQIAPKPNPDPLTLIHEKIAADPGNWVAYNELGVFYAKKNQNEESAQAFAKSVEIHPDADVLINLSIVYDRLSRWD